MKRLIVPALALAGAVGYGAWLHHHLDVRARLTEAEQQNSIAYAASLSDSLAQQNVTLQDPTSAVPALVGSIDLHTPTLDDRLADTTIARDASLIDQRLERLGSDAADARSALESYQQKLRETHEMFEIYRSNIRTWELEIHKLSQKVPHILQLRSVRLFYQNRDQLYRRALDKVHAVAARRATEEIEPPLFEYKHYVPEDQKRTHQLVVNRKIREEQNYARDEVIIQAIRERDVEMLALLHIRNPLATSYEAFQQELERYGQLCLSIDMKPSTNYRLCIERGKMEQTSVLGPKGTEYTSEYYLLFEDPFLSREKCGVLSINGIHLGGIQYIPPKS